jgi:hypothetical protein
MMLSPRIMDDISISQQFCAGCFDLLISADLKGLLIRSGLYTEGCIVSSGLSMLLFRGGEST